MQGEAKSLVLIDADVHRCAGTLRLLSGFGAISLPLAAGAPRLAARLLLLRAAAMDAPLLQHLRGIFPRARIVLHLVAESQQAAIAAFRLGVDDVLAHDTSAADLRALVARCLGGAQTDEEGDLRGTSPAMRALRARLRQLAATDTTVLISGETGTGKENAALVLHRASRRARAPLVALNCAAIPEALIEGELFGHERGAFSGAVSAAPGKLQLADGGTLLLDEVGEFSLTAQAKVLRALEARSFYRLGARTPTQVNVRVIAATNRDLRAEVQAGRFRADLFYRIAVADVRMPPLREHPDDIPAIARHLLADRSAPDIDDSALALLALHDWPGNVRELRNVLEAAAAASGGGVIRPHHLPPGFNRQIVRAPAPADERDRLLAVLHRNGGNKSLAAAELGCSRMTLYRRLARLGLEAELPPVPLHRAPPAMTL